MATASQILANRSNAKASTGPSTPEGKFASSKNATRHGLSTAFTVLPHESCEEFQQLDATYRDELQPGGEHESFLVDQMVQARWKLARIERLEAAAFEQILTETGAGDDPDSRILGAITRSGNVLDKLQRYSAAATRAYYQARREFEKTRAQRLKLQAKAVDSYIRNFVNAPMPAKSAPVQNEAKSAANLALRL